MSCCPGGPPKLPTFNLLVNIWRGPYFFPVMVPPTIPNVPCQLVYGQLVFIGNIGTGAAMYLKVPKLTDIRHAIGLGNADFVECPAATGRYYSVGFVDDLGKGFPNEHRVALLLQQNPWIFPTP